MTVANGQTALAQDIIKSTPWYAADSVGTDSYAITLPTAPSAYSDGAVYRFKAGTANTGACTLNVNSLGAIAIKRPDTTDTQTGDIVANQIVEVVYRGGSFYMTSPSPTEDRFYVGALKNSLVKTYFNVQLLFILWTGSSLNDTTTTFANWIGSDVPTAIQPTPGGAMVAFADTGADSIYLKTFNVDSARIISWSSSNIIVLDWWAKLPASSTGDIFVGGFGSEALSFQGVWNDTSGNGASVKFAQKSTGELMAVIAEESVGVSSSDISAGLTLTNWNNYRIELDLGTDAKFYVNGALKATLSGANLEVDTLDLIIGFGRSNTALFQVTAPTLSLQMNP